MGLMWAVCLLRSDVLLIATGSRPALDPFGPFSVDYEGTVNLVTAAKAKGYKKARCFLIILLSTADEVVLPRSRQITSYKACE